MTIMKQDLAITMLTRATIATALLALVLPNATFASTTTAAIREVLITESHVYVYPVANIVGAPGCHGSNGNYYSFLLTRQRSKEYLAALLSAQAQGAIVRLYGAGNCDDQPNVSERLEYLSIISQ